MRKITFALVLGMILVLVLIATAFFFIVLSSPKYEKEFIQNPAEGRNLSELVIGEEHVTYMLNEIGAYMLHNTPTGDMPRIEIAVDDEKFNSEIDKGVISTLKGEASDSDIRIISSRDELAAALGSGNVKEYMKSSVSSGKTRIELVKGHTTLFFKGYLNLYKDLTGKSVTGSAIKIFEG